MGKKPNQKGWADRLLDPFKQRLSLTEPGKKQAPMRKGKTAKKPVKKVIEPLTTKARQVKELKTMYDIGVKDPERLARIISKMLQEANRHDEEAQLKFERLVWAKAEKQKPIPPGEM
ncbi:MAG: hypothetical protein O3B73_05445 [bacterium]|jgi:hypothetical protein|nr:hypothetical protein [bacterium]